MSKGLSEVEKSSSISVEESAPQNKAEELSQGSGDLAKEGLGLRGKIRGSVSYQGQKLCGRFAEAVLKCIFPC